MLSELTDSDFCVACGAPLRAGTGYTIRIGQQAVVVCERCADNRAAAAGESLGRARRAAALSEQLVDLSERLEYGLA